MKKLNLNLLPYFIIHFMIIYMDLEKSMYVIKIMKKLHYQQKFLIIIIHLCFKMKNLIILT